MASPILIAAAAIFAASLLAERRGKMHLADALLFTCTALTLLKLGMMLNF